MYVRLYTTKSNDTALDGLPIFNTIIKFMNQSRGKFKNEVVTKIENKFNNLKFNIFPNDYRLHESHCLVYVKQLGGYIKLYLGFRTIQKIITSSDFVNGEYNGDVSLIYRNNDYNYDATLYNSSEYLEYSKTYFASFDLNGKKVLQNGNKLVTATKLHTVYTNSYKQEFEYIGKFKSVDLKYVSKKYNGSYYNRNYYYESGKELTNNEIFHLYVLKTKHSFEYTFTKTPKRLVPTNNDPFLAETILLQYLKFDNSYISKGNTNFDPQISFPGLHYVFNYLPSYYIDFDKHEIRMKSDTDIHPHVA